MTHSVGVHTPTLAALHCLQTPAPVAIGAGAPWKLESDSPKNDYVEDASVGRSSILLLSVAISAICNLEQTSEYTSCV